MWLRCPMWLLWCRGMIDRAKLTLLVQAVPKAKLATALGVSLPTLRQIIKGHEPHAHIAEGINRAMARLLPEPMAKA